MGYPQAMNQTLSPRAATIGFMLFAALLVTSAGCQRYGDSPRGGHLSAARSAVLIDQDDYVYYPGYQMYYGSRSHQYFYQEGSSWVSRPAPRGLSASAVLSLPSVRVDFHDSPAAHHAQILRTYPKNWTPPGGDHDRKQGPSEGPRDERKDDNKR